MGFVYKMKEGDKRGQLGGQSLFVPLGKAARIRGTKGDTLLRECPPVPLR